MRLYLTCDYTTDNIACLLCLLHGPRRGTAMDPFHMGSQMEATLRGTCVDLRDEGCAIHFRALKFTLHPDTVHFQVPLAVHE